MKKILMSVHPKWCEKIFTGLKTIEVRKTFPKQLETPFEAMVYCTKDANLQLVLGEDNVYRIYDKRNYQKCYKGGFNFVPSGNGKVIGSFVCDNITVYESEFWGDNIYERIQERWEPQDFAEYGEYGYDTLGVNGEFNGKQGQEFARNTCLSWAELREYIGQGFNEFCGWHITAPKLYDTPRELSELAIYARCGEECSEYDICMKYDAEETRIECPGFKRVPVKRAPQSWCYVEGFKE